MPERRPFRVHGLISACALAPILLLAPAACTEPDPNVIVRVEIRHQDGRRITAADSIPWLGGIRVTAVALNGRGDPVPEQPSPTWSTSGAIAFRTHYGPRPHGVLESLDAVGVGTGTVTATMGDKTAQRTIKTYLLPSRAVRPWPDMSRMLVGMSRTLVVRTVEYGTPMQAGGSLRWETSDASVATVDQEGKVTTVGEGHATITAVIDTRRFPAEVFSFRYPAPLRFASVTMASGYSHLGNTDRACGVTTEGALYCWGLGYGYMGTEDPTDRCMRVRQAVTGQVLGEIPPGRCSMVPVAVRPDLRFTSVRGSQYLMCALSADGTVYCWGAGLGTGARTPTPAGGDVTFQSIDVAPSGSNLVSVCGVSTSGAAYCWGETPTGPPGSGLVTRTSTPVAVEGGLVFQSVRAGATACGITTDGATYCWGANDVAQAGAPVGTDTKAPVRVGGDLRFVQVAPAGGVTCGLADTGGVYCWGAVGSPAAPSAAPVPLSGGLRFARLAERAPCGVTDEGTVYCWDAALVPAVASLPFPVRAYGQMNGGIPGWPGAIRYALSADGLLYWWDNFPGRDASTFFYHMADVPDGLNVGSTTPVLVPGQQ